MKKADPTHHLVKEKNIWNLAIIDNIDFKDKNDGPEEIVELTADTPLFGMNSGINKILLTFQEVFQELLDLKNINGELSYRRNFDAESVKRIILFKLDHGCLGPSPNIIILEPGNNPNSDEEILRSAEMYKKDFSLENYDFLDIVADEAIYHHLIKDSLAATRPLFASAAKSNYTTAIAHFLASLAAHPRLKKKLNHAGSFKIPHENNDSHHTCFGFDEALETFGIKFIKKNITGNIIDDKNLKNQIKACQDERERIDLLMYEYLNDKSASQTE
ncbi:hypothetical protein C1645_838194 [Glomus cerebriforme]|uniref:Uncharacterized protein n=1 Tax=Glomus cerebriforme TaxID=658196 RepID=A0A397S8T0_9GLOM|nr:hypothetical protein C1645_838194 [Glomus cerebriforme]